MIWLNPPSFFTFIKEYINNFKSYYGFFIIMFIASYFVYFDINFASFYSIFFKFKLEE